MSNDEIIQLTLWTEDILDNLLIEKRSEAIRDDTQTYVKDDALDVNQLILPLFEQEK